MLDDLTLTDPLTWNCPHIGADGWGCGAAAGEPCDWTHDPPPAPDDPPRTFHAERRLQADGGGEEISRELIERVASDLI